MKCSQVESEQDTSSGLDFVELNQIGVQCSQVESERDTSSGLDFKNLKENIPGAREGEGSLKMIVSNKW